jgi:hypothetical protein
MALDVTVAIVLTRAHGLLTTRHLNYGPVSWSGDYSRVYIRRLPFTLLVL